MSSESRQVRERQPAAVHMNAAEFGAAVQRRKHLARIEKTLGVERAFQPLLLAEIGLAEHVRHQIPLLNAAAMLAGQDAAQFDAASQNGRHWRRRDRIFH